MGGRAFSALGLLLAAAVIAAVAGLAAAFAVVRFSAPITQIPNAAFPLTEAVERFTCPKGLTRIALTRGIEDGFAPGNAEPATIDPRLLHNGFFADLASGAISSVGLRGYDQGGADKSLIDHFIVPRGIVSGKLVMRIAQAAPGSSNDNLRIGDLDALTHSDRSKGDASFSAARLWAEGSGVATRENGTVLAIEFTELLAPIPVGGKRETFLAYLNDPARIPDIDLVISDDTTVDALALLACQLPVEAKGVTFAEERYKRLGRDVSWLSCSMDQTQHACDPFSGDRLCREPGPLACYHEGGRTAPGQITDFGINQTSFVGGEVRLSEPVRGDRFAHLGDANGYCEAQFGAGWRVLSYHEGGGGTVVSYSLIAPQSRALVNIRDQQYANCWDRELKR